MKLLILVAGMAASTLVLAGADSPVQLAASPPVPPSATARNADAEKLIDELVNISTETVGAAVKYSSDNQFIVNLLPSVHLNEHGVATHVELPPQPPVMLQLAQMGVAAVPSLLDHLTDARATKLIINHPPMTIPGSNGGIARVGVMVYGDEYDPRHLDDLSRLPKGLTFNSHGQAKTMAGEMVGDAYIVRVGDLCYALLGQIVNRKLNAARYQPTACIVINSPVHTPALAAAARADWAGLTAEQHRASLELDAANGISSPSPIADKPVLHLEGEPLKLNIPGGPLSPSQLTAFHLLPSDAFERLNYYYPDDKLVAQNKTNPVKTGDETAPPAVKP